MLRRRGRLAAVVLIIALVLFAGRWTATFLTDRWWAAEFSPAAVALATRIHLLQLSLDLAGVLSACAWFVANLLIVARAVGSVQVPRHVGNLEFRETVTPGILVAGAVAGGVVLGLVVGLDSSSYWPAVMLAWRGVTYGLADPLLARDAGFYVAQLPLWRALHSFALLLSLVALATVVSAYAVIGAVKFIGRRVAVNTHSRSHIGWLLAVLALCLAWGYLLEPYELLATQSTLPTRQAFELKTLVAPALAGTALMVAVLSALWALRPRHALIAAGWVVLLLASVAGHYVLPLLGARDGVSAIVPSVMRQFEEVAFGLEHLGEGRRTGPATSPSHWPSLWDAGSAPQTVAPDSRDAISADQAIITSAGERRPVWLVLRGTARGSAVVALADDRVSAGGAPLFYRAADSLAYPTPYPYMELPVGAVRPGAPAYDLSPGAHGIAIGGTGRRIALAWALQAPGLLGAVPDAAHLAWRLEPGDRLARLLPFAAWSPSAAAIIDGRVTWLSDGYVSSETFPLVEPIEWRGGWSTTIRAAYLGTVDAESGETHIYRRAGAGALADAWTAVSDGVVEDTDVVPSAVRDAESYPAALFRVQSLALERATWGPGALAARPVTPFQDPARPQASWRSDEGGAALLTAYDRGTRRIGAVLQGTMQAGAEQLELIQLDTLATLPTPSMLAARWSRFPTYDQLRDSIVAAGAKLEARPVSLWVDADGLGATQAHIAARPGTRPVIAWVSMAAGERLGAARAVGGAWDNLRGASGPLPPGVGGGPLPDARRWMRLADAALRRGDWAAFGRAFDALRQALDARADSTVR